MAMGPGGIVSGGSYDPQTLSQEQRDWLWRDLGRSGSAPVGWGGEGMLGPRGTLATGQGSTEITPAPLPGQPMLPAGPSAEEIAQQLIDATFAPYQEALDRAKKFEEDNPFVFDEILARASSEERYDPYYTAELSDFMTGIERTRQRSTQDERRVLGELTAQVGDYMGRTKRELDRAIESSEKGYAGAGLFFSGERERRTGELETETEFGRGEFLRDIGLRKEEAGLQRGRLFEDLASQEQRQKRLLGAEKETAYLGDIEQQRKEALTKRELERQQYIGFPLAGGSQSFTTLSQFL